MKEVLFGIVLGLTSPVIASEPIPRVEEIVRVEEAPSSLENLREFYSGFVKDKLYGVEPQFENFKKFGAKWDKKGLSVYIGLNGNDGISIQEASFRYVWKF